MLHRYPLSDVKIEDPFWTEVQSLVRNIVLPYQWEILNDRVKDAEPSHCMQNFRIVVGEAQGKHQGTVFLDSDVYKWLEAVAYSLSIQRDLQLEACADEAITLIRKAQGADGYLNTYFTLHAPDQRFTNLTEGHELYCAGHLMEAAVAYFEATGKRTLLNVAIRLGECLLNHFQPGAAGSRGYPGHPEVELALIRLSHATGRRDFIRLAEYFINARGVGKGWKDLEEEQGVAKIWGDMMFGFPATYFQAHLPVREQRSAAGHAVRAMYLYCAMSDLARLEGDTLLKEACEALFEDVTERQMYVTGGIGSTAEGESFTTAYDLPNDTVYAETCAGIGLMMFASRMWLLTAEAKCYDIWEKALYNTVLAGMGKDGQHFFYVNPLAIEPQVVHKNPGLSHVATERPRWFGVACCPPNLARCVLSLGGSLYARSKDAFYMLSHIDSTLTRDGETFQLSHEGETYTINLWMPATTLRLRVPDGFLLECGLGEVRDGYLCIEHQGGEACYTYRLTPQIRLLRARPRVAADVGKVCCSLGQVIYCLEEADNGPNLCALCLPGDARFETLPMEWLPVGLAALKTQGYRLCAEGWTGAYSDQTFRQIPVELTFVPYSQWNNRGEGEMLVWANEAR